MQEETTKQQVRTDAKLAIQIEHSERNANAAPGGSSTDFTTQERIRTPYKDIKIDMILDGVV
eukprot:10414426-Heterocapsa_arctica.AAC.1